MNVSFKKANINNFTNNNTVCSIRLPLDMLIYYREIKSKIRMLYTLIFHKIVLLMLLNNTNCLNLLSF